MGPIARLRRRVTLPVLIGLAAASVGVIYGYDLSNIAGALLFIERDFGLTETQQEMITTATVIGEIAGAAAAGWLANALGRKRSMVIVAVGYAAFALLGAASTSVSSLTVARLLLGVTIGVSVVVVPVFVAESAPASARGALLVTYGVATVVGIIAGYLCAYLLSSSGNWRAMLGLAAVPAVVAICVLTPLPDTARWYVLKGRADAAQRTLRRIEPEADADWELGEITRTLHAEHAGTGVLREMLRPPYARATLFVVTLGFLIQITGINAIVYYSPRLFEKMGFEGYFALLVLPAIVQAAALVTMVIAMFIIDRVGRRPILLGGITAMIVADMVLVATFAAGDAFGDALAAVEVGGVLLFTLGYTFGFGSLVWVYAGEALPARMRSIGASAMLTSDLVANAMIAAVFLSMLTALGGAGTFAVLGILAVASMVFVYRYAPETKGRHLEDIRHFWENGGAWPADVPDAPPAEASACH